MQRISAASREVVKIEFGDLDEVESCARVEIERRGFKVERGEIEVDLRQILCREFKVDLRGEILRGEYKFR